MAFCPVCGALDHASAPRCERVARFYGYDAEALFGLARAGRSIAVPFFEIKRFFYLLENLVRHPLGLAMLSAVERAESACQREPPREFGNDVWVVPFSDSRFPECTELYLKEDVSKTMVIYQQDGAIEHLGSEERAVLFAEMAERFFGLGDHVPPTACGLTSTGKRFVVSAGLSRDRYVSLESRPRQDLPDLWRGGLLPKLTLLDFVLGQDDRSSQNVLFSDHPRPLAGLIDNDDSFVTHERLAGTFAYLDGLCGDLDFAPVRDWFSQFRLPLLIAQLSPLALPEAALLPLCRRFVFAQAAVDTGLRLRDFRRAAFIERPPLTWQLAPCPWTIYLPLIKEGEEGTSYRTLVGEPAGSGFALHLVEGKLLDPSVTCQRVVLASTRGDADEAASRLALAAMNEGFVHVVRRRFFVRSADQGAEELRIVEVRGDSSGFHVVVKRGKLGYYETRQIETYISFGRQTQALARADVVEGELLASRYVDLRTRLSSFKATGPATLF